MVSTTTTIIASISSALRDSNYETDDIRVRNLRLMLLKTFVLCGKKLRNDAKFQNFLVWIEETLQERDTLYASDATTLEKSLYQFFHSLEKKMDKWYVSMLDCSFTPQSTSLMINEILEIITSNLEIISSKWLSNEILEIIPFEVQMRFLKSLIHFVTKGSIEARKDLLAHSETIAINVAYVLFRVFCIYYGGYISTREISFEEIWDETVSGVLTWVQKIKPIAPQVYAIYTQSLSGAKLSKQSLDDDGVLAMKNFLDSLMSTLAVIICVDTRHVSLMKDELYERLGSLRIIFERRTIANFDMEIQKEIAHVITDAGISICSTYQPQRDVNFGHRNLLEKFEILLLKIADMDPQIPIFNSPRTSSYGFVDCVLEKMAELASSEAESTAKSHFETIQVELASVRSSLGEVVELRDEQVEFQTLWDRLLEVSFKVERVLDYQVINPLSISFSTSFDSILEDIGDIKADVLKMKAREGRSSIYSQPSQKTSTSNEVIGFQDEERAVLDRLTGGSQHLRLIAIVGMPGLGKTTLAKKVYNHSSLSYYFSAKAWCPISQVLDKKEVLCDLLKQICPNMSCEVSEHDLADQLRRSLKRKRYLIFLDDIWSVEAWNSLKDSFPNDPEAKGSRIIFTSRSLDVAPREMLDQEPLIISPLSENDSLKLLSSKLFPGQEYGFPHALQGLGMQIVARCKGLPLAIIIVGGVLANAEVEAWERILGSFNFLSSEESCRYTLEFSYRHLPDYLRPCFLYFGAFPEDQEVPVWKLLRLWIAEGFVRKSGESILEDVAKGYLNMLISRSLIMIAKQKSNGGVKTCRIHDLLRDFCLEKAKDEHFFYFAKGYDEFYSLNEPRNLRRLLTDNETLRDSNVYFPHTRSLLLSGSGNVYEGTSHKLPFFKLLKVLDLEQVGVGNVFPSAIQQLVLLTFLAIKGYRFTIPSWLANLSNLETLSLIIQADELLLPANLWNMQKLKYLFIRNLYGRGGVLPIDNLDDSPVLHELECFKNGVIDWCSMEKQLRKFPNVRKLTCLLSVSGDVNGREYKFVFPDFSSKLESLSLFGPRKIDSGVSFDFASLTNLKKLKLAEVCLNWESFLAIGNQLPGLEVLKLDRLEFVEENALNKSMHVKCEEKYVWEMKRGEFSKLRILDMRSMYIRRWIAYDDHEFECFQKLVLRGCHVLEELPSCLETIETLEEIELNYCTKAVEDLVTTIEEAQNDWGNSVLKITRSNTQTLNSQNSESWI